MQASSRYLGNSSMITDLRWTAETTRGNSADLPPQSQSVFPYSYLKRKRQEKFKSFDSLAGRSVLFSRMNVFLSISLSTSSPPAHLATRVCSSFPPRYFPTSGPSILLIALPRMLSTNFSAWVSCSVWLCSKASAWSKGLHKSILTWRFFWKWFIKENIQAQNCRE